MSLTGGTERQSFLELGRTSQLNWLKTCQILKPGESADGAICRYPGQGWVIPYFANFAALAMLEDPLSHSLVERYLDWYLHHCEADGTILNYHYDANFNAETAPPDSEDAYAGTFLLLVARFRLKTGNNRWVKDNLPELKKIGRAITRLMGKDGLTRASSGHRIRYLMDNCEVYRGLADFAGLLEELGDAGSFFFRARAGAVAGGIERLWDRRLDAYHPGKARWFRQRVNLKYFYPDAACQLFPSLYALSGPKTDKAFSLYRAFNLNHPNWVTIRPPDYPWVILGYCACLAGDYTRALEKLRFVLDAYVNTGSGNWICAEAAFFVLTCSLLLEMQGCGESMPDNGRRPV